MAEIFQEDFFTRITNVHWNTGSGIFVTAGTTGEVYLSEDGFSWSLAAKPFGDAEHGQISDGAFGGGVFFLAGNTITYSPEPGSDRINSRKDALAVASSDGRTWRQVTSAPAPGVNDFNVYFQSRYVKTGFKFKLLQGRFDGPDGPTLTEFANAGSDGNDDPTVWNGGDPFTGVPVTPVGPPSRRVTMQVGAGFTVVITDNGKEQTHFSTIPGGGPRWLCYGGRSRRVFVTNGFDLGTSDELFSNIIFASYDALTWTPAFTLPQGGVSQLLGGMPQTLRRGKKA